MIALIQLADCILLERVGASWIERQRLFKVLPCQRAFAKGGLRLCVCVCVGVCVCECVAQNSSDVKNRAAVMMNLCAEEIIDKVTVETIVFFFLSENAHSHKPKHEHKTHPGRYQK